MSGDAFYSPYQFIPVTGRLQKTAPGAPDAPGTAEPVPKTAWDAIKQGQTQVRHDCWQPGTHSGRLLCRLTTVTPTLIGAEQQEGDHGLPGTITNYRGNGELAIPASSLRGAIGAVAEAISQSAMRVLEPRAFSVRKPMGRSLKAIGLLRRQPDGNWRLLPLALTGLPVQYQSDPPRVRIQAPWNRVFPPGLPLIECLAAYYGNYGDTADNPARFSCFHERDNPRFVYSAQAVDAHLAHTPIDAAYEIQGNDDALKAKGNFAFRRRHLQDLRCDAAGFPGESIRGVTYVLGLRSAHDLMPNKKHEWFVPYAEDWEERLAAARNGEATLPVQPAAIAAFERIARERYETNDAKTEPHYQVPFLPKGYGQRKPGRDENCVSFLRDGDLLYFDVDSKGQEVKEISFSSIWRAAVSGDLYDAFKQTAGIDALPLSPRREDGLLTPAECLFGVVEELPKGYAQTHKARNLASRVRFSDAHGLGGLDLFYAAPVALRQLQSPKPPSPAMYFRTNSGGAVRKQPAPPKNQGHPPHPGLDLKQHAPNGRKHYLVHDPREVLAKRPWETRKLDSIDQVAPAARGDLLRDYARQGGRYGNPLKEGQTTWFHVDFDNLSQAELDLLCTAIDPGASLLNPVAGPAFHHRLGWGRPVGLGVVRIAVEGLFLISRRQRYSAKGIKKPRYQTCWLAPVAADQREQLQHRYPDELAQEPNLRIPGGLRVGFEFIDPLALAALMQLGNLETINGPVSYPYSADQRPYAEEDGFKWFVNNDNAPDTAGSPAGAYQYIQSVPVADADAADTVPGLPALTPNRSGRSR